MTDTFRQSNGYKFVFQIQKNSKKGMTIEKNKNVNNTFYIFSKSCQTSKYCSKQTGWAIFDMSVDLWVILVNGCVIWKIVYIAQWLVKAMKLKLHFDNNIFSLWLLISYVWVILVTNITYTYGRYFNLYHCNL